MQIIVNMREVYGETKVYPVCEKARLFAEIAGTRTLTPATLKRICQLGYAIEVSHGQGIAAAAMLFAA
jgi:hypothetical protein